MKNLILLILITSIFIISSNGKEKSLIVDNKIFNKTDDYLEQTLTKEQLENIWTPVKLNNGKDGHFGLGWEAYRLEDNYRMVGHGGAGISSLRHYWNDQTNKNVTVVLLTNGAYNWFIRPNQINAQIADILLAN